MKVIIGYITKNGEDIALKIRERVFFDAEIKKLGSGEHNEFFKNALANFDVIIAIMAVGIVVRGIAKYIKDKMTDSAIIVIDEKGRYVISLLSGHVGGANEISVKIASAIDAQPVITTSSDINNYPAIDVYAKKNNYTLSDRTLYKKVVMAMLDGKKIPVYLEKEERKDFFENFVFDVYENLEDFKKICEPKIYVGFKKIDEQTLYLVPRKLVLGIGFHKGISKDELFKFIEKVFIDNALWLSSVAKIATIDKRKGDKAFEDLAKRLKAEIYYYSEDEIKKIDFFENSQKVLKYHKVGNISESCAFLASNGGEILLPKIKGGNITLCVAKERYL